MFHCMKLMIEEAIKIEKCPDKFNHEDGSKEEHS